MKKILFLSMMFLSTVNIVADDDKYLTINYGENREESIELVNVKKITFTDTQMVITTTESKTPYYYNLSELTKLSFTADATALEQMAEEAEGLKMQDGKLVVTGKGALRVYSATGALVAIANVDGENKTVNLSNLTSGVYIVNLGNQTIKIRK